MNRQMAKGRTGEALALEKTFEGNDEVSMLTLIKKNILFGIMAVLLVLSLQGCYVGFFPGHGHHDHGGGGSSDNYRHGGSDRHR